MTTPRLWSMHGLVVRCDTLTLDARRAPADARVDVEFRMVSAPAHREADTGADTRVLAHFRVDPTTSLTVTEVSGGAGPTRFEADFEGVAVASVNADASVVELAMLDGASAELAPVLVTGTLISLVLTLRGHPVLHASSVVVGADGSTGAIAFVGHSGIGKSTLATLACRDGARLLGDDVLRTDLLPGEAVRAWPGALSTRLRPAARALGEQVTAHVTVTGDGRSAALLVPAGQEPVPLLALVVPQPDRSRLAVHLERIRGIEAVITLARFPRIPGWTDPATSGQAHLHWGELARRLPVLIAWVPWGPPFVEGLGGEVIARVLDEVDAARREVSDQSR